MRPASHDVRRFFCIEKGWQNILISANSKDGTMFPRLSHILTRRMEVSDRGILLSLRWLFFLVLLFLSLYSANNLMSTVHYFERVGLLAGYALSNLALTWATRKGFSLE